MRTHGSGLTGDRRPISGLSCLSCRRRKVKCDRKFPQCQVCEQTSQTCHYPSESQKPGPKIGSLQRQRKRTRENHRERSADDDDDTDCADGADGHRRTAIPRVDNPSSNSPIEEISSRVENATATSLSSTGNTTTTQSQPAKTNRILDLSFVLHPSHETSSPENVERNSDARQFGDTQQQYVAIDRACSALGLRQNVLQKLVKAYFDNMVAINLFHEPSFSEKLSRIGSSTQISALLAAMLAFAVRFYHPEDDSGEIRPCEQTTTHQRASQFLDMALRYIDESLRECGDSTPPLCIIQASIIAAHCQLSQGVLGRAWRSLGTCVRLAYEVNLHLVDVRGNGSRPAAAAADADRWCLEEEKRRAFWAIWEMDVFATTIRRTPPAVDWSQIETLLPAEDEYWFQRKPQPSCFLERDPVLRWEALENSGNQSPKAWFIVINSLMKDAQRISSPRGVPNLYPTNDGESDSSLDSHRRRRCPADKEDEARQKLETIGNAVQCFRMAVPSHLKYQNQYLGFDARVSGQYSSLRQTHCSIYNIYMMTQLARLMIYRFDVFQGSYGVALSAHDSCNRSSTENTEKSQESGNDTTTLALKQYFEAADDMLTIVNRSCDDHVRYINPFLSNTIWLASAVQLLRSRYCQPGPNKSVVKSRFKVMHLTYKKCVSFWDMHTAVQQNFESLEEQLEPRQGSDSRNAQEVSRDGQNPSRTQQTSRGRVQSNQEGDNMPKSSNRRVRPSHSTHVDYSTPVSYIPTNANDFNTDQQGSQTDKFLPSPLSTHGFCPPTDWQATKTPDNTARTRTQNPAPTSVLDFVPPPPQAGPNTNIRPIVEGQTHMPPASATLIDPMLFFSTAPQLYQSGAFSESYPPRASDVENDVDWDWRLPNDFHEMLSGFFTS